MSLEICKKCNKESTPWCYHAELDGHICESCHNSLIHNPKPQRKTSMRTVIVNKTVTLGLPSGEKITTRLADIEEIKGAATPTKNAEAQFTLTFRLKSGRKYEMGFKDQEQLDKAQQSMAQLMEVAQEHVLVPVDALKEEKNSEDAPKADEGLEAKNEAVSDKVE